MSLPVVIIVVHLSLTQRMYMPVEARAEKLTSPTARTGTGAAYARGVLSFCGECLLCEFVYVSLRSDPKVFSEVIVHHTNRRSASTWSENTILKISHTQEFYSKTPSHASGHGTGAHKRSLLLLPPRKKKTPRGSLTSARLPGRAEGASEVPAPARCGRCL